MYIFSILRINRMASFCKLIYGTTLVYVYIHVSLLLLGDRGGMPFSLQNVLLQELVF